MVLLLKRRISKVRLQPRWSNVSSYDVLPTAMPYDFRPPGKTDSLEKWYGRSSIHRNAAMEGTASWEEFHRNLFGQHTSRGLGHGVNVQDDVMLLDWHEELHGTAVGGWKNVTAEVREIVFHHKSSADDRLFTALVIAAEKVDQVLVARLPVQNTGLPASRYRGASGITVGHLVSVQRVCLHGDTIRWEMAISKEDGGKLPSLVQHRETSSTLVEEVGRFMAYAARQRLG